MNSKTKRTLGIGSLIAGAALIVFSYVIKAQVDEGQGKLSKAEAGQSILNMTSYTKSASSRLNSKIDSGKSDIAFYTVVANVLLGLGIVLIAVGGGSLFFGGKSAR